jgi:hypothetical protein
LAQHEIDIRAPLDTLWRLHTNVKAWTSCYTDITEAHIEGSMEPGVSFSWSSWTFPREKVCGDRSDSLIS